VCVSARIMLYVRRNCGCRQGKQRPANHGRARKRQTTLVSNCSVSYTFFKPGVADSCVAFSVCTVGAGGDRGEPGLAFLFVGCDTLLAALSRCTISLNDGSDCCDRSAALVLLGTLMQTEHRPHAHLGVQKE
jgi:hypothetical protein